MGWCAWGCVTPQRETKFLSSVCVTHLLTLFLTKLTSWGHLSLLSLSQSHTRTLALSLSPPLSPFRKFIYLFINEYALGQITNGVKKWNIFHSTTRRGGRPSGPWPRPWRGFILDRWLGSNWTTPLLPDPSENYFQTAFFCVIFLPLPRKYFKRSHVHFQVWFSTIFNLSAGHQSFFTCINGSFFDLSNVIQFSLFFILNILCHACFLYCVKDARMKLVIPY